MRILAQPAGLYTYPDLSVVCGVSRFLDNNEDTLLNPAALFEILSPRTEAYERGRKAEIYRSIPSVRDLVIIAQDHLQVELLRRVDDSSWIFRETNGIQGAIELTTSGLTLRLTDLYEAAIPFIPIAG